MCVSLLNVFLYNNVQNYVWREEFLKNNIYVLKRKPWKKMKNDPEFDGTIKKSYLVGDRGRKYHD